MDQTGINAQTSGLLRRISVPVSVSWFQSLLRSRLDQLRLILLSVVQLLMRALKSSLTQRLRDDGGAV